MLLHILPALGLVAFGAAWLGTRLVLRMLRQRAILDHPNPRSSHQAPTPRGGGLAVVPVILTLWLGIGIYVQTIASFWTVLVAAAILAEISWRDDLSALAVGPRIATQFLAAVVCWFSLSGPVFQGLLPPILDAAATIVLWVWFTNLFNFMDGIDGISGQQAAWIGLGLCLLALSGPASGATMPLLAITLTATALGFLPWNWHPARIFLGDVGSIPLGFLLGWLLITTAANGYWAAALLLPLYYLADASLTLGRRALRGARFWNAHKEHYYQLAVQGGVGQVTVARTIIAANWLLLACAMLSLAGETATWTALAIGAVGVGVVLATFHGAAGGKLKG